jgi:hypothetical protein
MDIVNAFPRLGMRAPRQDFGHLRLISKSQLLRDKLKLLRLSTKASQEAIHQIDAHLNAISQESSQMKQWSQYELAYEEYASVAPHEDLLGLILDLRSSAHLLDPSSQDVWSTQKLVQLEQDVRQGNDTPVIREEIAALARAVYDGGLVRASSLELNRGFVLSALSLSIFFSVLVIVLLVIFQVKQISTTSPWHIALIGCMGACGGLLSVSIRLRRLNLNRDDLQYEQVALFFRAAVGAVVAVVVALFLQLRVFDFPFLHTGPADSTPLAPVALYVFAFLSGSAERFFFRDSGKMLRRIAEVPQGPVAQVRPSSQPVEKAKSASA